MAHQESGPDPLIGVADGEMHRSENLDHVTPADAKLGAMTETGIRGPVLDPGDSLAGVPEESPAAGYPVCLAAFTREEAGDMGAVFDAPGESLMRE